MVSLHRSLLSSNQLSATPFRGAVLDSQSNYIGKVLLQPVLQRKYLKTKRIRYNIEPGLLRAGLLLTGLHEARSLPLGQAPELGVTSALVPTHIIQRALQCHVWTTVSRDGLIPECHVATQIISRDGMIPGIPS